MYHLKYYAGRWLMFKKLAMTHRTANMHKSNFLPLLVPNLNQKFITFFLSLAHINGTNKRNVAFLLIEVNKTLQPTYVNV